MRPRAGFSLVELLIFAVVLGVLARTAVPIYRHYIYQARAAAVMADIHAVRVAAYAYHADTSHWPRDVKRGVVPPELVPYLGSGYTFVREHYLLDWDHWVLPDGTPSKPSTGTVVGVSLTTGDDRFGHAFTTLLGESAARATIGKHYTLIIVGVGP